MGSSTKRVAATVLLAIVVALAGIGLWVDRRGPDAYLCDTITKSRFAKGRVCPEATPGVIPANARPISRTGVFGNDAAVWWWFAAGAVLVVGGVAVFWPTRSPVG